jgi:PKHD-type hydroxylase
VIVCLQGVLKESDLARVRDEVAGMWFVDGKATAGWHARLAKANEQAEASDARVQSLAAFVAERLLAHEVFALAARPRSLSRVMISRYGEGMHYGSHVDDAIMQGMRSDVSFTVFLAEPGSYEGGELVLERTDGEQAFKLDAGDAVVYPSTLLHRVEPVTRGTRLVAVGWVQSLVRRGDQRELLFDLDTARLALFRREGKSAEFDLLSKCLSNLLRQWAEP